MAKHKHLHKRSVMMLAVFGVATVAFAALSLFGLAQNSRGAEERYNTLIAVDEAGGDVATALDDLRAYIYSHMNTQIGSDLSVRPPIQLRGTYERLVAAERDRVAQVNEALNPEAIAFCESTNPDGFSGSFRLDCIESYIDENGAKETPIEDDFYKFDFAPPVWSPDVAGFSIVLTIISAISFVVTLLLYWRTKRMVNS